MILCPTKLRKSYESLARWREFKTRNDEQIFFFFEHGQHGFSLGARNEQGRKPYPFNPCYPCSKKKHWLLGLEEAMPPLHSLLFALRNPFLIGFGFPFRPPNLIIGFPFRPPSVASSFFVQSSIFLHMCIWLF